MFITGRGRGNGTIAGMDAAAVAGLMQARDKRLPRITLRRADRTIPNMRLRSWMNSTHHRSEGHSHINGRFGMDLFSIDLHARPAREARGCSLFDIQIRRRALAIF